MKAVVMAGGLGTRLRPLTLHCLKTMVPLVNRPVLAHLIQLFKRHHFSEIIITTRQDNDQIQSYFGDGSRLGVTIEYVLEEAPLGTAGSIKNAQPYLRRDESFLVVSGDIVTDMDLSGLLRFHRRKGGQVTMALKQVAQPGESGVVRLDRQKRIRQYQEKPRYSSAISNIANAGVYVIEPEVLDDLEPNVAYDFSYDLFPRWLNGGVSLYGYLTADYWNDMGTISNYLQTTADVLLGRVKYMDPGDYQGNDLWTGREVELASTAKWCGPVYLGHGARIHHGATILGPAVIGDGTVIGREAVVERSVISHHSFVESGARLQNTVIPARCHVVRSVTRQPANPCLMAPALSALAG